MGSSSTLPSWRAYDCRSANAKLTVETGSFDPVSYGRRRVEGGEVRIGSPTEEKNTMIHEFESDPRFVGVTVVKKHAYVFVDYNDIVESPRAVDGRTTMVDELIRSKKGS